MAITTVTEASAVNTLLDHLLARPCTGFGVPTPEQARQAAGQLAAAAYRKLGAGVREQDVAEAWLDEPDGLDRARAAMRIFACTTLLVDETAVHTAAAALERGALADLVGQLDALRSWVAAQLELLTELVVDGLDEADTDVWWQAVRGVTGAEDGITATIELLQQPAAARSSVTGQVGR